MRCTIKLIHKDNKKTICSYHVYAGSHTITQTNNMYQQKVKFSIRYNFNSVKSKYRGTGAGASEKARM